MLLDYNGRPIPENKITRPAAGRMFIMQPADRYDYNASDRLTPEKVKSILTAAESGDIADQSRLALELEEKHWDIAAALSTRRLAVSGVPLTVEPGDDSPAAKKIAEAFQSALDKINPACGLDTFNNLTEDLLSALVPGFAVSEIVWGPGGELKGFRFVEQRHFTAQPDPMSREWQPSQLRLITQDQPQGVELTPSKFIVHRYRRRGGDVARSGLIRPLAWMHCFSLLNVKDLLSFVERYGMPFVVSKVDQETWNNERALMQRLIRSFGPSGGCVVTQATEIELLQAANNTGDVYFKLLEYFCAAINRVVLGQSATSSSGGGLSGDNAQAQVRQDILEADCKLLDDTLNTQLAVPWTLFNFGPNAIAPKITHHPEPPEDKIALATMVKTFFESGLEADEKEMSEKAGIKLTRRQVSAPTPGGDNAQMAGNGSETDNAGTSAAASDKRTAAEDSAALGAETGNDTVLATAKPGAPDMPAGATRVALRASDNVISSGAVRRWLDPLQQQIDAAVMEPDAAKAAKMIADLAADPEAFFNALDSSGFREQLENTVYASMASGMAREGSQREPGGLGMRAAQEQTPQAIVASERLSRSAEAERRLSASERSRENG